jgi:hypothetical protein
MGRTDLPFSQVLEQEVQEWEKFRMALRKEDQQYLDRLFETILISILLEHEKALIVLRSKINVHEEIERVAGILIEYVGNSVGNYELIQK